MALRDCAEGEGMKNIIGIDPGTTQSAFVIWDGFKILQMGIWDNTKLNCYLAGDQIDFVFVTDRIDALIIEKIESMGMAVGASVFETVYWTGIFACTYGIGFTMRMPRRDVKLHLCGSMRAKPANIRQALIDRFEPDLKPRQRPKGIMKGLTNHTLDAFALAVTWWDKNVGILRRE